MIQRPRILRAQASIRSLVQEHSLSHHDFLIPLFAVEGKNKKEEIPSMPGYFRFSLDLLRKEVKALSEMGFKAVLCFAKIPNEQKDNEGKHALNPDGLMQRMVKTVKDACPNMLVMTDVALDPYSIYGHDGIVSNNQILNDETVAVLSQMAVSHAEAGADWVAPSDMMDGRILGIRTALEQHNFKNTGIMSYSAKYASCFYGPFRDALDSAPGFGDKKTYQMNPANRKEGIKEALLDEAEGADMLMVKPALSYLDIIQSVKSETLLPVAAYNVSGEYSMIKAAANQGWIDEDAAIIETLISMKRAGADLIATYFGRDFDRITS